MAAGPAFPAAATRVMPRASISWSCSARAVLGGPAKERLTIPVRGAPDMAAETAWRMAQVVKTLVERPRHVAIVKGLKRKLWDASSVSLFHA